MPNLTTFNDDHDRISFHVQCRPFKDKEINVDITDVKKYGRTWGKILAKLGFASKIDEKTYVSTADFFQHLVIAWATQLNKINNEDINRKGVNKMAKTIENDPGIDKDVLNADQVEHVFQNISDNYIPQWQSHKYMVHLDKTK